MPIDGYFDTVFAVDGDLTTVPDALDPSGYVSFDQGYPIGYGIPRGDPGYLPIERGKMNYIFNQITGAIQAYQQFGTPPFITSTMNGGTPFSYSKDARVVSGGIVYVSLSDSNVDTPPSSNWTVGTAVSKGGTGLTSLTSHYLLVGNGTSPVTLLAPSAASGIPLVSAGSSADPAYGTAVVAGGGTGRTTLTSNNVILGNGTSAVNFVAPSTTGNVLTSDGSTWTSAVPATGTTLAAVFSTFWPVGSLYWNKSNGTNPSSLLGFGTWTQITDKFIVARGSTYTGTGGAATVTLSIGNLPAHTHSITGNTGATGSSVESGGGGTTVPLNDTGSTGSGTPFSIIPPYQAAYCWERIA